LFSLTPLALCKPEEFSGTLLPPLNIKGKKRVMRYVGETVRMVKKEKYYAVECLITISAIFAKVIISHIVRGSPGTPLKLNPLSQ